MKSREQCFDEIVSQPFMNGDYTINFIAPKEEIYTAEFSIKVDKYFDLENVLLFTSQYSISEDNKIEIKAKAGNTCLKISNNTEREITIKQVQGYLFFDFDDFIYLLSFAKFQVVEC